MDPRRDPLRDPLRDTYRDTSYRDPYRDTSYRDTYRDPYRDSHTYRTTYREPMMDQYRRPILHDNSDRGDRSLRDIQRKMDEDWGRFEKRGWNDDFDQICEEFFHLKPRPSRLSSLSKKDFAGSRESLDDDTVKNLFVESPGSKSRKFQISFNVQEYDPNDISVSIKDDTMVVAAKHETVKEGAKTVKEFSRKIKIPPEVDPEKLISKLSNDGILTISAPVPPKYNTLAHGQQNGGKDPAAIPMPYSPDQTVTSPTQPQYPGPSVQSPPPPSPATSPPFSSTASSPPPGHPSPPPQTQTPTPPSAAPPSGFIPPGTPITVMKPAAPPEEVMDTPVFSDTEQGRRMDLMLEIGLMYSPEDLLVKVEGNSLLVEATHEEKAKGKTSRSTMSREFDLTEDIDPDTVQASLGTDGKLRISARVPGQKSE